MFTLREPFMRPVKRGRCPTQNGQSIRFAHYREARDFLGRRIGDYCSYCEMPIPSGPDVEHIHPKRHNPSLERSWGNFLLACRYCNSIKHDKPIVLTQYYWPDKHNTFLALAYPRTGYPIPASFLTAAQNARVQAIIELVGLDRIPGHTQFSVRDTRWRKRVEVWGYAERSLANLRKNDTLHMRSQIIIAAKGHGFWSVWMTVFKNDADMLNRLIAAFPGTARDCFDANGLPVSRPGGTI